MPQTLNTFVAQKKREIFDDLAKGLAPREGSYDEETLRLARLRGKPQMGATVFQPHLISFEFVFNDPTTSALVLSVDLTPPDRVVFLPVPEWVIETIWQGEIAGSYHFAADAERLVENFGQTLTPEGNREWFERQQAKRRE